MINYVKYDPDTGIITGRGRGVPPTDQSYLVVNQLPEIKDRYVDLQTLEIYAKVPMTLAWPTQATAADGVAEAVISGLPENSYCSFYIGNTRHAVTVMDGTLELSVFDPQFVWVAISHPTFSHDMVVLEFV